MDGYDGDVKVGGPAQVRTLDALTVTKLAVGSMDNNAYLLRCRQTGEGLLVDAAAEADRLLELVGDAGVAQVLTTHRHRDHWSALTAFVRGTGASTLAGSPDAAELPVHVDRRLEHGDTVAVGDVQLEIIALRGHTPGSVAVAYTDPGRGTHVFTGDSLFPGGVGRTTSPSDFVSLLDDVEQRLFARMRDDTLVYPGHGADTTLGVERPHLAEWRARGW